MFPAALKRSEQQLEIGNGSNWRRALLLLSKQMQMRFLIVGWFSVEGGAATAGDLLTRDLACEWIASAGYAYDMALAPPFDGGVDVYTVEPNNYSHVVFVCGPFQPRWFAATLCRRFRHCRLIGLNVSMNVPLEVWNPFDGLIERDSSGRARADIAFLSGRPLVPVIGVCLVEAYEGAITQVATAAIERVLSTREVSVVRIDTRLDVNSGGLRTPAEIESLLARMDVVITTRLHGAVLALKNGVPAIAIDPEPGGAKLRRQAETIGWPVVFNADGVTDQEFQEALDYCLSDAARTEAQNCAERAKKMAGEIRNEFIMMLIDPKELDGRYSARINAPVDEEWILALERSRAKNSAARYTIKRIGRLLSRVARSTLPSLVYSWLKAQTRQVAARQPVSK
jgi:Polysaccharide pyruvyl transferase